MIIYIVNIKKLHQEFISENIAWCRYIKVFLNVKYLHTIFRWTVQMLPTIFMYIVWPVSSNIFFQKLLLVIFKWKVLLGCNCFWHVVRAML